MTNDEIWQLTAITEDFFSRQACLCELGKCRGQKGNCKKAFMIFLETELKKERPNGSDANHNKQ